MRLPNSLQATSVSIRPKMLLVLFALISVVTSTQSCVAYLQEKGPVNRQRSAVPDKAEVLESTKEIKTILGNLYSDRSADGKKTLANELMKLVEESPDNLILQYACLSEALKTGAENGLVETSLESLELICKQFEVDTTEFRLKSLNNLIKNLNQTQANELVVAIAPMIDEVVAQRDYGSASLIARKMLKAAKKSSRQNAYAEFDQQLKLFKTLEKEYRKIQPSLEKLEQDQRNPGANLVVGKFYCFNANDFETGLSFLSRSSDAKLKGIAELEKEHSRTQTEATQTKASDLGARIADFWWDYSEELDELGSQNVRQRAGAIYRAQLDAKNITGISKARAEKRLRELAKAAKFSVTSYQWVARWLGEDVVWDPIVFTDDGKWKTSSSTGWSTTGDWVPSESLGSAEIIMKDSSGQQYLLTFSNQQITLRQFKAGKLNNTAIVTAKP